MATFSITATARQTGHLKKVVKKQDRIQKNINRLSDKRKEYILEKQSGRRENRDSFDHEVLRTLKKQAEHVGVHYK